MNNTSHVTVPVEQLENWRNDLSLHGVGDIQTAVEIDAMLDAAHEAPAEVERDADTLMRWANGDLLMTKETIAKIIKRAVPALRAQPPAREDAKACYDCATDRPHRTSEACASPAPDALRVAVEALEAAKPLAMGRAALSVAPKIIKALAALQAEQKGGA